MIRILKAQMSELVVLYDMTNVVPMKFDLREFLTNLVKQSKSKDFSSYKELRDWYFSEVLPEASQLTKQCIVIFLPDIVAPNQKIEFKSYLIFNSFEDYFQYGMSCSGHRRFCTIVSSSYKGGPGLSMNTRDLTLSASFIPNNAGNLEIKINRFRDLTVETTPANKTEIEAVFNSIFDALDKKETQLKLAS